MKNKDLLYNGFHKIEEVKAKIKGKNVLRERLLLPSAVGALVIDEDNRIALVSQYRPTVELHTKEIPAGVLDKGKTRRQTLLEELEEECMINKEDILHFDKEPFNHYFMVTGSSDAEMSLYTVRVKRQEDKVIEEDNDVDAVEWVTIDQLKEFIDKGNIIDAKTLLSYNQAVKELE